MINMFVQNLSFEATEAELQELFVNFGEVTRVQICRDRETQHSRGFGFVEMPCTAAGLAAIAALDDSLLCGRRIGVEISNSKRRRG